MNTNLTREQFDELLLAYTGALNHVEWARRETNADYERAVRAASEAYENLRKAVFG